jgi:methylenetetrahydrofolate--tRNA-(uracil-5-)-methyltransferase
MDIAFRASRYGRGTTQSEGDYINCPFHLKSSIYAFVERLRTAERIQLRDFEKPLESGVRAGHFFEGCLPVEIIAERGDESLAYGPMRPVGLRDPQTWASSICGGSVTAGQPGGKFV